MTNQVLFPFFATEALFEGCRQTAFNLEFSEIYFNGITAEEKY